MRVKENPAFIRVSRVFLINTGFFLKKHDTGVEPASLNRITIVFTAFVALAHFSRTI